MNYWFLNVSASNCTEPCNGICVTKKSGGEYVSKCVSNAEHNLCNNFQGIYLSFCIPAINVIVYTLTFYYATIRSREWSFFFSLIVNFTSSLLIISCLCYTSFEENSKYWIAPLAASGAIFSVIQWVFIQAKCGLNNCCCCNTPTLIDYDLIDGTVDEYLDSIYDNPPLFTMKFNYGKSNYQMNIKYGSWELASERIQFENRKRTTLFRIKKSKYESDDEFDQALQARIDNMKNIFIEYRHDNSVKPNIVYQDVNIFKDSKIYTTSCFVRFMKSICGKIIYYVSMLLGIDVILANICCLNADVIDIDIVKKASMKKDLETPAHTVRGQSNPITLPENKLPDFLHKKVQQRLQARNEKNSNSKKDVERPLMNQNLIDKDYDEKRTIADNETPLETISPIIPNTQYNNGANDIENPYI